MNRQRVTVALVVLLAGLAAASLAASMASSVSAQDRKVEIPPLRPAPGGPFSLVDHTGRRVTDQEFRGQFTLVQFGYTYCPDICPTSLQAMSETVDRLGAAARHVQPIFITVDPERDTAEVLSDYVDAFHPRLIGLTGTPAEIKAVAKAYGVRYFKLFYPWSGDDKDEDGNPIPEYAVHHTAFTYLMGPNGRGLLTFPHGAWPEDMARELRRLVGG